MARGDDRPRNAATNAARSALRTGAAVVAGTRSTAHRPVFAIPVSCPGDDFLAPVDPESQQEIRAVLARRPAPEQRRGGRFSPSSAFSFSSRSSAAQPSSRASQSSSARSARSAQSHVGSLTARVSKFKPLDVRPFNIRAIKTEQDAFFPARSHKPSHASSPTPSSSLGSLKPISSAYSHSEHALGLSSTSFSGSLPSAFSDAGELPAVGGIVSAPVIPAGAPAAPAPAAPAPPAVPAELCFNDYPDVPPPAAFLVSSSAETVELRADAEALEDLLAKIDHDPTITLATGARYLIELQQALGRAPMSLEEARAFLLERVPRLVSSYIRRKIIEQVVRGDEMDKQKVRIFSTLLQRL